MKSIYTSILCSCIICKKQLSTKGINSHFLTLHTIEGNNRVKANAKIGNIASKITIKAKYELLKNKYNSFPNKCTSCNAILPYAKRKNKYCNASCSATYNNVQRVQNGWSLSLDSRNKISTKLLHKQVKPKYTKIFICKTCNKISPGTKSYCSKECLSVFYTHNALNNNLGNKGMRSSKSLYIKDSFNNLVRLESSYEIAFSTILNNMNIQWLRPEPFNWLDVNNKLHRYYPDFYLPEYNIYFDPKNKYLIERDQDKINRVIKQNNINVVIVSKENITLEFISKILNITTETS